MMKLGLHCYRLPSQMTLYETLEREVLPAYAARKRWVAMMQASIATIRERFSADRMLREYFARLYARE